MISRRDSTVASQSDLPFWGYIIAGVKAGLIAFLLVAAASALHALWWTSDCAQSFRQFEDSPLYAWQHGGSPADLARPLYNRAMVLLFENDLISFGGQSFLLAAAMATFFRSCLRRGLGVAPILGVGREELIVITWVAVPGYILLMGLLALGIYWEP
jgi:hypothetical protein